MGYWINVHHPRATGESRTDQLRVCVQEKSRTEMTKIPKEDLVVIYETNNLSGTNAQLEDSSGRKTVRRLGRGAKGIVGLVRLGEFHPGKWKWNEISFVGSYDTVEVKCRRGLIPLEEVNEARAKAGLKKFNPRFPGGLRPLTDEEFTAMRDLMGTTHTNNAGDWSSQEVWDTTCSYMSMLERELTLRKYSKAAFRRKLLAKLTSRTEGAIEYKYQNISAVLAELEHPYIIGYQPNFGHYQRSLKGAVSKYIARNGGLSSAAGKAVRRLPPKHRKNPSPGDVIVDPPPSRPGNTIKEPGGFGKLSGRINYVAREAANRDLGRRGEEFVVAVEKARLVKLKRADLADKVEWITKTKGDGLGYDIVSYDDTGNKVFIEVKTTNQGKYFPFLVSANEVAVSKRLAETFRVYRVFQFSTQPHLYVLRGSIPGACSLQPVTFKAML